MSDQPGASRDDLQDGGELIGVVDRLADEFSDLKRGLKQAIDAGDKKVAEESKRRDRRQALFLLFDYALTIVATVATTFALIALSSAGNANRRADVATAAAAIARRDAEVTHQNQLHACQFGNTLRAQQRSALDNILGNGRSSARVTAAQRKEIDALLARDRAQVASGWRQLNCGKLYPLSPSEGRPRAAGR